MRIAVGTDAIWNGDRASITFALELLSRLPALIEDHDLVFHDDSAPENDWDEVEVIDRYADANANAYLSFHGGYFEDIPGTAAVFSADRALYPEPDFWSFLRSKQPDPLEYLRSETNLIVPHEKLRQELIDQGIPAKNITKVGFGLPAINNRITPADPVTRRITKEVYGKEHSYFFAPTQGHPSDNLERLFAAYDLFRARCPEPVRLLVEFTGKQPRSVRKAQKQAKHSADIVFLPQLSPHEHRNVFSSARAILYPSLSTAFPLPVLDAWTAEVPVLATDNNILQGGGALVHGELVDSIAEGMVALVTTPFLASGLVENGKRRLADFSWDRVAERVAEVLRSVAQKAEDER